MAEPQAFLTSVFDAAVAAVHPAQALPAHLPPPPKGHIIVLAAGKAAAAMAAIAEQHYLAHPDFQPPRIVGIAATRPGHGTPTHFVQVLEAGHPLPDAASKAAADAALRMAGAAHADDLVLVLLSGGASANWAAPAPNVTLVDKQALTQELLRAGVPIDSINAVRKHLSRIKGGRLARAAAAAPLVTLAISDVPRDDPAVIGSGPSVPDPTTLADARAILARNGIAAGESIYAALADPANETPKADAAFFANATYRVIARPRDMLDAAAHCLREAGYAVHDLGGDLEGEARSVAHAHARMAAQHLSEGQRCALLSGGELTVTVRGKGRGGPNQEYALALLAALPENSGISALAADTDGADGGNGRPDDPAGALFTDATRARMRARGLDPRRFLDDNDSSAFFAAVDGALVTGPTFTNVNDLRIILIDPAR